MQCGEDADCLFLSQSRRFIVIMSFRHLVSVKFHFLNVNLSTVQLVHGNEGKVITSGPRYIEHNRSSVDFFVVFNLFISLFI